MSSLNIKEIKLDKAINFKGDITLKRDGCMMTFRQGNLISDRNIVRNDRFRHILSILRDNECPDLRGEIYIEGGNVFDVTSSINWKTALLMPFDLLNNNSVTEKRRLIDEMVDKINSDFITKPIRFNSVQEGWNYVLENNQEGLVLRNGYDWFKLKKLNEVKIEISSHEPSKEKGTFVLINGNRVSGTSKDFVRQFREIKAHGKIPIAEIEFVFKTKNGSYFQPRLRKIYPFT